MSSPRIEVRASVQAYLAGGTSLERRQSSLSPGPHPIGGTIAIGKRLLGVINSGRIVCV